MVPEECGDKQPLSWMETRILEIERTLSEIRTEQKCLLHAAKESKKATRRDVWIAMGLALLGLSANMIAIALTIRAAPDALRNLQAAASNYLLAGVITLVLAGVAIGGGPLWDRLRSRKSKTKDKEE